jgi:DNA-binding CsgD family transcriptional regulator
MTANLYSLGRGIRTKALYQNAALGDRATVAYLSELAGHGASIRFIHAVPGRTLIIDREVVTIRLPTKGSPRHSLVVVKEPNIVAWAVATFEQLWADATTLEEFLAKTDIVTEIDPTRRSILRLMAEGEKDEAISRKLSISVRTCRRHIAEYMMQVGANSRFQAGVIAARAGHTDEPSST